MKNKTWQSCSWMILCMVILFMVLPASGTVHAQEEGGYWEQTSVNVLEAKPRSEVYTYTITRGSATISADSGGDSFSASMTWTEPELRYAAGESLELVLKAEINDYNWYDDEPGYTHLGGLNYMSAFVQARIDEPEMGTSSRTGGAIDFKDSDGKYRVEVKTDYGKIVVGSHTLKVSAKFPHGGYNGGKLSVYIKCDTGVNRYNYQWVKEDSEALSTIPEDFEPEPEPEWEASPPTTVPGVEGLISRVIVVVGITIAGTLSAIAANLANKAAQAAASGKDEQPAEEIVYVLNPSHKRFNLEIDKPVKLDVYGYKVTQGGYQTEPDAQISIDLPPDMADYIQLQGTSSPGQISCIITLLKIPSTATVPLDIQGVFPHGKKVSAQVQLAFKMEFAIYPVRSPNITYYEKDQQWQAPELVACFRDPVQETPLRVGFYYGFTEPPLTFEPDILEVKEGYSSDDGLTYNFKLNVRDGIDLETYFGEDLTDDDGRVAVKVVVKDEQGKEYAAETELQLNPQLRMIACSYNKDVKKRGLRATPYEGLKLDELEFIADGIDKLPLVIFFIRSDKEVTKGSEAEAAMDIVEVRKIEWSNSASFEEPEVNKENTGKGFFAYDLSSSELIATDKNTVNGVYGLEVDARICADGPKNYSFDGNSMRFLVKPQFILLRLWVVPGHKRSTSDAIAYAKLLPSHKPFTGLTLTLETSGGGGATLITSDGSEKVTQIQKPHERKSIWLKMPKGMARWILTYSGLTWSNLSGAQFQVTCKGPKDKFGNYVTASDSFDVNANVTNMLSDLLNDSDIQAKMNNPYHLKENDAIPEFLNGPVWNCYQKFDGSKPYVCGQMRFQIIDYLKKRRHYRSEGDLAARLASMRGMNGIEYENYYIYEVHAWAGFFLSGNSSGDYKALDPWWEQRWVDPSFNKPENLMTMADEVVNVTKLAASAGAVAAAAMALVGTLAAGVAAGGAAAGGVLTMLIVLKSLLVGMTLASALAAAGVTDFTFSSVIPHASEASVVDNTMEAFPEEWLIGFIQRLDQQDLNKWRKP